MTFIIHWLHILHESSHIANAHNGIQESTEMKFTMLAASAAALAILATPALAANAPKFTASCPMGIEVKSNGEGKIRINGHKASVKTFNSNAWEARHNGITVNVAKDGTELIVSYTVKGGDGICQVTSAAASAPSGSDAAGAMNGVPAGDLQACLAAVSNTANNGEVDVLDAIGSEANNQVTIGVGSQKAPWKCLVKNGQVADVMSLNN